MAKILVKRNRSTDRRELIFGLDTASATGAGKTGITSMTGYYTRNTTGAAPTAASFTTSVTEINLSNMPGVYHVTIPSAAFANTNGADTCVVYLTATGMAPVVLEYQLVAFDPDDPRRLGLTALPDFDFGNASGLRTAGDIADAVWDEQYSEHTTSGSFGKLMNILRKANLVTEGVVTSATANNTVMQFVSTTTDIANKADDHWRGQTLLFVSGNLTGQSTTVARFNTTTNTITVDSPLTEAPALNDEFVMMPVHIHPIDEIGEAFLSARLKSIGQIGIVSATTINADPVISGVNSYVLNDTVTFLGSAPTNFVAGTKYHVISANLSPTTFRLSASQGGTVITPGSSGTYVVIPYDMRTVRAAMQYLRNKVEIVSSTLNVYTEDDTAKAWTAAVATSGSTTPITSSDPA